MAVFNKFKPLDIWIKIIFLSLLQQKLSFITVYTQLVSFGGLFVFLHFKQVWSLGFLFNCFKMDSTLCKIYWITIIEIGLFYGGEHLEAKFWSFQTFFGQHGHFIEDDMQ